MPNDYSGWSALGDMVAGGPRARAQDEYVGQYRKNAQAAGDMWKARRERHRAISQEGINQQAFIDANPGLDPAKAALAASTVGAAATPNYRNAALGDMGDFEINRQREEAQATGNFKRYNQLTALLTDKIYQPVIVDGGAYRESGGNLGDLDLVPTLPTLFRQQTDAARIQQRQPLIDAQVGRAKRIPAKAGGAGKGGKQQTNAAVEAQELADAREAIQQNVDPAVVAAKLRARGFPHLVDKVYRGK